MRTSTAAILLLAVLLPLFTGCATTPSPPADTTQPTKTAWALTGSDSDLLVSVSPAGRALRIAGSAGTIVGTGVDAVVNDKYRRAIEESIGDYVPGETLERCIADKLQAAGPQGIERVAPLGSTAGYSNVADAEKERFGDLAGKGFTSVLDLDTAYGLYGPEAQLVITVKGVLRKLPGGSVIWRDTLLVTDEPILMGQKLTDPTVRLRPNLTSPRLSVEQQEVMRWTAGNGEVFKQAFGRLAGDAASTVVTVLGYQRNAAGEFQLGRMALFDEQFDAARERLEMSLALAPDAPGVKNALAVTEAYRGNIERAIELGKQIIETTPDYAPAHHNLAWWLAIDKANTAEARVYYDRAIALGLSPAKKLEEIMSE